MENTFITKTQNKKVEKLHYELQGWKSNLDLMDHEILFICRLLNSYVFQPNTLNLFERLQDFQLRLKKTKDIKIKLKNHIAKNENNLGGMLECTDESCDLEYYRKHGMLKAEVADYILRFRELKSEIFNYAGGILKKNKPYFKTVKNNQN